MQSLDFQLGDFSWLTRPVPGDKGQLSQDQEEEDDGCAALLALQSAVYSLPDQQQQQQHKGKRMKTANVGGRSQEQSQEPDCNSYEPNLQQGNGTVDGKQRQQACCSEDTGGANGSASSGGSAKDVLYAGSEEGVRGQHEEREEREVADAGDDENDDELSDMEVDVVSATEKGCQVFFPPLPGEAERRRQQRRSGRAMRPEQQRLGSKRKLLAADAEQLEVWGAPCGAADPGCVATINLMQPLRHSGSIHTDALGGGKWRSGSGALTDDVEDFGCFGGSSASPMDGLDGPGGKRRLIWSQELHDCFLAAIKKLGVKNAVPKAILTLMDVEVRGWGDGGEAVCCGEGGS